MRLYTAQRTLMYWGLVVLSVITVQVSATANLYHLENYKDHPCNRPCEHMSPPRLCHYMFLVENYWTLSKACLDCPFNKSDCFRPHCIISDGVSRGVVSVNRQIPGPPIEVCKGDTIEVELFNALQNSEGTSIHWHGILQRGTPYMDGVSMVTQCPITPESGFTYRFVADQPGTFFWHGHAGMHQADGMYGALIVRQAPVLDPHSSLYDYDLSEHVIIVNDWRSHMTISEFVSEHHDAGFEYPLDQLLINGLGKHAPFTRDNVTYYTPRAEFTVQGGKRYRFRVISNAIFDCPIQISVDGHTMTMIGSDGNSFEPFVVDSFNIFAGERYDFILHADKTTPLRNFWIRARGEFVCEIAYQTAILRYEGAPDVDPPEPSDMKSSPIRKGILLNPLRTNSSDVEIDVVRMRAEDPDGNDGLMTSVPDKKFYLAMDFYKMNNIKYNHPEYYPNAFFREYEQFWSPQINRITSSLTGSPPLSQHGDIPKGTYCNEFTVQKRCEKEMCYCVHKLDIAMGDLVELILIDEGNNLEAIHPMHLHGFKFRTLAMKKFDRPITPEEVKAMDERGEIIRSTSRAPLKDTVWAPHPGYAVIRFRVDNPGMWFFHCHILVHVDVGMSLLFQAGSTSEFPKLPKNFPRCGTWPNDADDDEDDSDGHGYGHDGDDDDDDKKTQPILVQCINGPGNSGVRQLAIPVNLLLAVTLVLNVFTRALV